MSLRDLYLLSPEIALAGLAIVVVILDLLVSSKKVVGTVAFVGLAVPVALTLVLWADVLSEAAVFGTLAVDRFALFFKLLVLAIVAVLILGSADYVARFQRYQGEFYALVLFSATGMMLLAATTELISIYISLELTALPLAALAAFLRDERSTEAGIKFLLLSAMSSALLLYGMVLVYGFTGSTHLQQIAQGMTQLQGTAPFGSYAMLAGVALMVVGFGFKIAMVPFQMWAPDVYEGAPTPITAYLSVASKAAGFAVLLRVFYFALPAVSGDWSTLFAVLSALSMTVGNLVAIAQNNIKRMLAYSTIAHAGYLLVGVAAFAARTPGPDGLALGPSGVLFYLAAYAATNLAAFFAIIAIASRTGSEQIDDFAGMARRAPLVAAVLAFAMLSLIGIPPTAGFIGKLYLFNAAVRSDLVWLAVVGVINSVVSAYYYLRVIRVMYLGDSPSEDVIPSSRPVRLALALTGGGILAIGLLPGFLLKISEAAVHIFSLTPN